MLTFDHWRVITDHSNDHTIWNDDDRSRRIFYYFHFVGIKKCFVLRTTNNYTWKDVFFFSLSCFDSVWRLFFFYWCIIVLNFSYSSIWLCDFWHCTEWAHLHTEYSMSHILRDMVEWAQSRISNKILNNNGKIPSFLDRNLWIMLTNSLFQMTDFNGFWIRPKLRSVESKSFISFMSIQSKNYYYWNPICVEGMPFLHIGCVSLKRDKEE